MRKIQNRKEGSIVKVILDDSRYNQLGKIIEIDTSHIPYCVSFEVESFDEVEWYTTEEIELVSFKETELFNLKENYK